jgi:DNA-directed RNA polymerase subunit RPC12/RpoP
MKKCLSLILILCLLLPCTLLAQAAIAFPCDCGGILDNICSNCGAWNEFELIEKRNKTSYKGKELVSKSKSIYNKDHEFVGTIEEGYEWQNRTHFEYDAVYRCKKCGNEIIVHKKV